MVQSLVIYFMLFFLLSIIFIGSVSSFTVIVSVLSAAVLALIIVFKLEYLISIRKINLLKILKFILYLVPSIYIGSVHAVAVCLRSKGKPQTELVCCRLRTKDEFHQNIICQGITLTPGTLVTEKNGDMIYVLKFKEYKESPEEGFDKIFKHKEKDG